MRIGIRVLAYFWERRVFTGQDVGSVTVRLGI